MTLRQVWWVTAVLAAAAVPARAADEKKDEKALIAHVALSGDLDEAPAGESIFGSDPGQNLKQKLDRIAKAKTDAKVKALLIELHDLKLGLFGFGKVNEVRAAIADFRKSGKKAYAYVEEVGGLDYLIACACDRVVVPEGGSFGLTGLHLEMSFYKNLFEKVHVQADFLTMGEAKGAAEPFTRTEMSPENRKQYNLVLDDLYDRGIVQTIIDSRPDQKWDTPRVKAIIDEAPYTAKRAKELGLIDHVAYFDAIDGQVKQDLKADLKLEKDYLKPKTPKLDALDLLMKMMSPPKKKSSKKTKVAIIYAVGGIETGKGGPGLFGSSVGSTTLVEAIREAETDATVKAIVLRVDSPGGSALASDLIWHELKRCQKPVVASMGDVAASGGYYITMSAKKVFAEPGTLTGSIGVLGGKIVIGGVLDWAGVKTENLVRGKNAGLDSMYRPFSETEKKAVIATMQDVYDQFLDKALAGRNANGVKMDKPKLLTLAGGRIWTGRQAKEAGLVDALGTLEDAIAEAKSMAKLSPGEEVEYLILPEPGNPLDALLDGKFGLKAIGTDAFGLLKSLPEAQTHLRTAESLLRMRGDKVWLMLPYGMRMK
ncbi:MAG TPA: signal peptide peptidase SppA [Gemmataceae bacterium]|nr:signal peptide peptidase SppA [Gemmataceae bacterium]